MMRLMWCMNIPSDGKDGDNDTDHVDDDDNGYDKGRSRIINRH
jgi:hypothetical protein